MTGFSPHRYSKTVFLLDIFSTLKIIPGGKIAVLLGVEYECFSGAVFSALKIRSYFDHTKTDFVWTE